MSGMLKKQYEVYSEKYDIKGSINDYDFLIKICFSYQEKPVEIALSRPFPDHSEEAFLKMGTETIDSYIENLLSGKIKERKLQLHYWYIDETKDPDEKETFKQAHGMVSGHMRLADAISIHTSEVKEIVVNEQEDSVYIHTMNSVYCCPAEYCNFYKQDERPDMIPNYEAFKAKYKDKIVYPSIEPGNVLLVLSNFDEYYFHSLYYREEELSEKAGYSAGAHIGTFQDSYLIRTKDGKIDVRYFPHFQNIEFYVECTDGKPLFIENIGDVTLYAKTSRGMIKLEPGERKEVKKENAEKEKIHLPGGDLYPAGVIE